MMQNSKSKEKPFGCTFPGCCKFFARKDCQQLHIKSHTGEKSYVCETLVKSCLCEESCSHAADTKCGKSFITSSHLNRHKKTHRDLFVHVCDVDDQCTAKYKKKSQLRQHKLDAHNLAEFLCEEEGCGRHFVSKAKLIIHQKSRHGGFMCPVITCSAMFPTSLALAEHLATHDSNVRHIKKRPRKKLQPEQQQPQQQLPSSSCGDGDEEGQPWDRRGGEGGDMGEDVLDLDDEIRMLYAGDSYLDDDDEEVVEEGEGACDDDDNDDDVYFIGHVQEGGRRKRGRSSSFVSQDMAIAAGTKIIPKENAFHCPYPDCSRSFNQNKNLEAHVRALHSRERPYPCPEPYCGQAFGFKSVLERHMLRCHGRMVLISQPLTSSSLPSSSSSSSFDAGLENFTATTDKTAVIISSSEKKTDNADQQDGQFLWNNILGVNYKTSATV